MKRYLGSYMDAFLAILIPLYIVAMIAFAAAILASKIEAATIMILLLCVSVTVSCCAFMYRMKLQFYSVGTFSDRSVKIRAFIFKQYVIEYEKCESVGIGLYVHGALNSNVGSKVKYFFFSYKPFDEKYRLNINAWRPSATQIKVGFSKKLYKYLLTVLPEPHADSLKSDYEKYVMN